MMSLDLDQLRALAAAVAEGTLDAAARALHVTPSAISQRIKALETSTGQVLLIRSKPVRPTAAGEVLLRASRQIDAITADAARQLGGGEAGGPAVIALAVNADSLATWFVPALASIGIDLVFDLRRADETRTAELLRDGTVMAAVTASARPVPGCAVEPLGRMRYRPRASPDFAARWFPDGVTPHALALAPVVVFDREDELQDRYLRRRTRQRIDPPRHHVPGSTAFAHAVRVGFGWGMVPDLQAQPGDFVEFDPPGSIDVRLYWQQWRLGGAALERTARTIRAHAAAVLR